MATGNLKFDFRYQALDRALKEQVARMTDTVGSQDGCKYSPLCSMFGRLFCCLIGDFIFVPLHSNTRPMGRRMLVLSKAEGTYLDPSQKQDDCLRLASALRLEDDDDAVAYHQVTRFDFAVVEKHSMLVRIKDEASARTCGFAIDAEDRALLSQGKSLWWQRWGGVLYSCEFSTGHPKMVVSWQRVRNGVGDRERLPVSLAR